ncbi:helix-turn-helix domain-containing protein [Parahaliea mediterranea]
MLSQIRDEYEKAAKQVSLAETAARLRPVESIGVIVREERLKQDLTLNELSDLSGVAYATLSKLERDEVSVRIDTLSRVLSALGLKLWVG